MSDNPPFVPVASRRAPEQAQISISISRELLARIDSAAKAENRNRSNFISTHMERLLEQAEQPSEPKQKKKKKKSAK